MVLFLLCGCAGGPGDPTILTLWHNYGGQLKEAMDGLIDEFNDTVGAEKGMLAQLDLLFSPAELAAYIPQYLEEGRLNGENLYIFPTAKSTEVLFLNRTAFDRFAGDTEITIEDLESFEGIGKAAALYYEWTDSRTPDIDRDGKAFFMSDSLFNYALVGCRQLGAELINQGTLNLNPDSPSMPGFGRAISSMLF